MRRRTIGIIVLSVLGVTAAIWLGAGLFQAGYTQGAEGPSPLASFRGR